MIITAFSHNQNYLVIFQISSVHFIHPYFSQLSRVLTGINNNCVYFILYSVNPETAPHSELKFIVFYSMLIILFSIFCFNCKEDKPQISLLYSWQEGLSANLPWFFGTWISPCILSERSFIICEGFYFHLWSIIGKPTVKIVLKR